MAHPAVLDAVRAAFNVQPNQVIDRLHDTPDGRVLGLVVVQGDQGFDQTPDVERSRRMWEELRRIAGPAAVDVGVVMLKNPAEAAALGL